MKKIVLLFALTLSCTFAFSQNLDWGIKAGLNYNANGDYFESISDTYQNPDRNIGFHFGLFGKIGRDLYFKPELVYTSTKSDYDSGDFSMKKIDAPLLVGVKLIGPISVFGGPSLQYILDSEFENINISEIDNDFSVGLNFGFALNFEKFGIDVRYERGFSDNEAQFLSNNNISIDRLDTRPEQIILSLSVNL